jgi:hypothetical protein
LYTQTQTHTHTHEIRHVETIPGMGGVVIKENDEGGYFNYDILQ